jgi:Tol biopolymer transport system component
MLLDPASGISSPFSEGTDGVGAAEYSPDGSMVVFQSLHLEGLQVWLQQVDHGVPFGPLTRVSREGGIAPIWSRDGHSLYYIRWRMEEPQIAHLMSVQIQRTPNLAVGAQTEVADWSGQGIDSAYRFDIHPNGDIVRIKFSPKRKLVLLQNWMQLVEDLAGGAPTGR